MLTIALFAFAGCAALCLAMEKHFHDLLGRKPKAEQLLGLRIVGWLLLALALTAAVADRGWAMGLVELFGLLMAGLCLWVFLLPYRPRWLLGLAFASLLLAPFSALGLL
ncbi:DUF3325 domain-containing protein [Pseudomonas sp. 148P]|uniref:DUF3325 domain-containing protein n=1 Tax=Pseudomonas ulcerans TaxID=3115852 RepID=A0ABU7HRP3_9PSED|nr:MULTISPECIES: DUF3325 domain-containing protein [unclassified Pseudomonas]MEE1923243.1 DUF3325 domain-containing protein [Pseudomonas sp. 147P]MEE1934205.1 DUF3325 domain-containing protein [Pseudomonas sp. 148P]